MNHESQTATAAAGTSLGNDSLSKLGDLSGLQLVKWALLLVVIVAAVCSLIVALQHSMAIGAVILFVLIALSTASVAGFWIIVLLKSYLTHRDWQTAVVATREKLGRFADRLMPVSH